MSLDSSANHVNFLEPLHHRLEVPDDVLSRLRGQFPGAVDPPAEEPVVRDDHDRNEQYHDRRQERLREHQHRGDAENHRNF